MSEQRESPATDWETFIEYASELLTALDTLRAAFADESDTELVDTATDVWELLDNIEDVIGTMDLSEAAQAFDVDDLPEAIDIEDVPEGLVAEDESAIDLTHLEEAVDLRELWGAVDLTSLSGELTDLDEAIDEVTDEEGALDNVVEGPRIEADPATRQAYMEEIIETAAEEFREVLLASHEQFRKLYRENQERFGTPGRQPDSRNPTAVSTMPAGPLPDSASTRTSTVPARVRHSSASYHPDRIFGRRFAQATQDEEEEGNDTTDERQGPEHDADSTSSDGIAEESATTDAQPNADESNYDDIPRITVHGSNE